MTKRKLQRFAENETFAHVFQPRIEYPPVDFEMKGKWHEKFFMNENPIVLELGCGRGEYTVALAEKFPRKNFIGIDWKGARLWRGAKTAFENKMKNVAFIRTQINRIESFFGANEVSEIWITFPDPHPQLSRERRRLTSPRFLNAYKNILSPKGILHLKTDNSGLHEYTIALLQKQNHIIHHHTSDLYDSEFADDVLSIQTTYENIFTKQGFKICYSKFSLQ